MSEKIKPTKNEQDPQKYRFPEDPNQYSEEELLSDPAKRFHVNPIDFPIFSSQAEMGANWGDKAETLSTDETMGRFVKSTADCIAVISGEDEGFLQDEKIPAADHVIYLDKSARPVSWLNNVFWDAFTDKPRPEHSYLAIDRMEWFARTDTPVDSSGYIKDTDGRSSHVAHFEDFLKENVSAEDIARIRALYIPNGIENEDIDKIMNTPTSLEGKNITIIDEVGRSGSTLNIAKYLVSLAIPEAASVNGYTFWNAGFQTGPNGEHQMRSVPVWYDAASRIGRGIGDVNEDFFTRRYEQYPTPKTRAQKFGSIVLGEFLNLSQEPGNRSRQLAKEIKDMREEWDNGHIIMPRPDHYNAVKWMSRLEEQGVQFVPEKPNMPRNAYLKIMKDITSRPSTL